MLKLLIRTLVARNIYFRRHASIVRSHRGVMILMYHEVAPRQALVFRRFPVLCTTPECFALQIEWLQKHFEIVSMDRAQQILQNGDTSQGRYAVITSDDGWMGFHQKALPILSQRRLPATVYVVTSVLEGKLPWYVRWRLAMDRHPELLQTLAHEVGRFDAFPNVDAALQGLKQLDLPRVEHIWKHEVEQYGLHKGILPTGWFIGEAQLQEAVRDGITIGSHTVNHPILTNETETDAQREINESKRKLEGLLNRPVNHFAYPNGGHDDSVVGWVRQAGYSTAVTTEPGWVQPGDDQFRMPRVDVHEAASVDHRGRFDEAVFALHITGEWARIRQRLRFLQ